MARSGDLMLKELTLDESDILYQKTEYSTVNLKQSPKASSAKCRIPRYHGIYMLHIPVWLAAGLPRYVTVRVRLAGREAAPAL